MRKIAIRIDDVTPEMDWKKFSRFAELLDRYEIGPLIGVVPKNQDPMLTAPIDARNPEWRETGDFARWLTEREAHGWSIAVHGYYHKYSTTSGGIFPLNHFSEFAGLSYETQMQMLREGRQSLSLLGIDTDIFMAPGHSYDKTTLRALKDCGYRFVTDGYGSAPYERDGLIFLPISFLRSSSLRKKNGVTTFVVHTWDMDEKEYQWYEKLISGERERFISYHELLQMNAKRKSIFAKAGEYLLASGKHLAGALRSGGDT